MSRQRGLLGVGILALLTVLSSVTLLLGRSNDPVRPGPSGSGAPSASASPPVSAAPPATVTFEGAPFGGTGITKEPTAGSSQAKLWFNDGTWWGTFVDAASGELRIGGLDWATQRWTDTGTLVDDRPRVLADALWDGGHLVIVTSGSKPTVGQAARLVRFSYDAKAKRYTIDPDFPLTLTATGVDSPVVVRDTTGILWLSYVDRDRLVLRHTLKDDHLWSPVAALPMTGADGATRTAALTVSDGHVTLVWNRRDEATLRVADHPDDQAADAWTLSTTDVEGLRNAPGAFSVRSGKAAAGLRLFIAFETAADTSATANSLAPGAIVMIHEPDGSWTNIQLARVKDHLVAPVLAVDEASATIVVIATATSTGQIVYKLSSIDRVAFESGRGNPLVAAAGDPAIKNPTTTKQTVDTVRGFVVLGADDTTGRYLHGVLAAAANVPAAPQPSSSPGPSPTPPPAGPAVVTILRNDTFNPWPAGSLAPGDWVASAESGGGGRLEVVAFPSATNHSLRLTTTTAVGSVRACAPFAPTAAGFVTVSAMVRMRGIGLSDVTLGSIRGPGGEAVSVRVTKHAFLAYYSGGTKVTTTAHFAVGAWYHSTIIVRIATQTYDWTLQTDTGRVIARIRGAHWRQAAVPAVDTFCAQTGQGRGGALLLDNVEVRR